MEVHAEEAQLTFTITLTPRTRCASIKALHPFRGREGYLAVTGRSPATISRASRVIHLPGLRSRWQSISYKKHPER